MKVGSLVMNRNRYLGQVFMVIDTNKARVSTVENIRCQRVSDGYKTSWCNSSTWTIIA